MPDPIINMFAYKCDNNLLSLNDYEEAVSSPVKSYMFVLSMQSSFIKIDNDKFNRLQESACKLQYRAYLFALRIKGADINYCCNAVCNFDSTSDYNTIFNFARDIKNISEELQIKLVEILFKTHTYVDFNILKGITSQKAIDRWNKLQTMKKACG